MDAAHRRWKTEAAITWLTGLEGVTHAAVGMHARELRAYIRYLESRIVELGEALGEVEGERDAALALADQAVELRERLVQLGAGSLLTVPAMQPSPTPRGGVARHVAPE